MSTRLPLVDQTTGKEVGWIQLADAKATFSDEDAEKLFRVRQSLGDWSDQETFDKLATGWSNGYTTIPAGS